MLVITSQEEYARARMRILGPGNGNNLPVSVPSNNQQRNHNSPQAMQRSAIYHTHLGAFADPTTESNYVFI